MPIINSQYRLRPQRSELNSFIQNYKIENAEKDAVLLDMAPGIRARGYITKDELRLVANWKSPRSKRHIEKNSEEFIRDISTFAYSTRSERSRISALTLLDGVEWPTASVLLHFFHRDPYPILDFRALWSLSKEVPSTYKFNFWWGYTTYCRWLADEVNLDMRSLDQALWQFSFERQGV